MDAFSAGFAFLNPDLVEPTLNEREGVGLGNQSRMTRKRYRVLQPQTTIFLHLAVPRFVRPRSRQLHRLTQQADRECDRLAWCATPDDLSVLDRDQQGKHAFALLPRLLLHLR